MNLLNFSISHDQKAGPKNKLQRLAFEKGYYTASTFATAVSQSGAASYGLAHANWNGRAGKTQYNTLLAIAQFLGASSVEQVFDP